MTKSGRSRGSLKDVKIFEFSFDLRNDMVDTNVHGLCALQSNLEFLSVFHCGNISPSTKLPAYTICSELNEEHLIVALKTYMDRPDILGVSAWEYYLLGSITLEQCRENATCNIRTVALANLIFDGGQTLFLTEKGQFLLSVGTDRYQEGLNLIVKKYIFRLKLRPYKIISSRNDYS